MAHLVIVRHGKTEINEWNELHPTEKRVCGQLESPLLPEGEQGAINVGKQLAQMPQIDIQLAISSDLERALQTTYFIVKQLPQGKDIPVRAMPELREIDYGVFAGKREKDLQEQYPKFFNDPNFNRWKGDFDQKAPGGENYRDIDEGSKEAMNLVLDAEDGDILIVSHLHVLRVLLHQLLGLTREDTCTREIPNTRPIIIERGHTNTLVEASLLPNQK